MFSVFMVDVLPCVAALVDLRDVHLNASMIDTCSFLILLCQDIHFPTECHAESSLDLALEHLKSRRLPKQRLEIPEFA